jgi:CRP-like cAMP-binding protein
MKETLSKAGLFRGLEDSELALFAQLAEETVFPQGDIIFKEGDPGNEMFMVLHGVIEIWKSEGSELRGSRLTRLKDGDIFGEMALFDKEPRSATALAEITKETRVLAWRGPQIRQLLKDKPVLGVKLLSNILSKVSGRLRVADDTIHTLLRVHQYVSL